MMIIIIIIAVNSDWRQCARYLTCTISYSSYELVPLLFPFIDDATDVWQSYVTCQGYKVYESQGWEENPVLSAPNTLLPLIGHRMPLFFFFFFIKILGHYALTSNNDAVISKNLEPDLFPSSWLHQTSGIKQTNLWNSIDLAHPFTHWQHTFLNETRGLSIAEILILCMFQIVVTCKVCRNLPLKGNNV